jgi:hypothetical protein
MSDEELVERLRSYAKDQGGWHNIDDTCEEAADRIEQLGKACAEWADVSQSNYQRAKAAEAKLAKAVEALRAVDALDPEGMIDGCSQSALRGLVLRMGEISRATLAEIKGDSHD